MPSPTPGDPNQVADLVVTWSGIVLAGFTLLITVWSVVLVIAGIFGFRELKSMRAAGDEVREKVREAEALTVQVRSAFEGIGDRMNSLVEVSYLFNQGEAAYRDGSYEKAVDFLGRAATLDPKNVRVLYRLGRSLTNVGDDVAAPGRFEDARECGLLDGSAERGLALAFRYSDRSQALRYAEQAVQRGADNARNWNCLGLIYRDAGRFQEAQRAHERAAELDRDSATTPFYLALLEAQKKSHSRALDESHEAVYRLEDQERRGRLKPMWAELIRWTDYILKGQYDKADELTPLISTNCSSLRRAREISDHMDFLLRALEREVHLTRYLGPITKRWPQLRRFDRPVRQRRAEG
jgi:tetratricopeptide (TPR) repeat protein